jgi:hypothetical protein
MFSHEPASIIYLTYSTDIKVNETLIVFHTRTGAWDVDEDLHAWKCIYQFLRTLTILASPLNDTKETDGQSQY